MLPAGGLPTSASSITPYENCPLQYYYGSLLELVRPTGPNLVLGSALHDVLEAFHDPERNEPQTRERLFELAAEEWREGCITPRALEVEFRARLDRMLQRYWEFAVAPGLDADILAVEQRFAFDLDSSTVRGRIDRTDRLDDGSLRLIDYKSSKKAMTQKEAVEDLQLALYALAFVEDPALAELGEVQPHRLPLSRLRSRLRPACPPRPRRRLRALRHDPRAASARSIREIAAEHFEYSPDADCDFCQFKSICPRHHGEVPV